MIDDNKYNLSIIKKMQQAHQLRQLNMAVDRRNARIRRLLYERERSDARWRNALRYLEANDPVGRQFLGEAERHMADAAKKEWQKAKMDREVHKIAT